MNYSRRTHSAAMSLALAGALLNIQHKAQSQTPPRQSQPGVTASKPLYVPLKSSAQVWAMNARQFEEWLKAEVRPHPESKIYGEAVSKKRLEETKKTGKEPPWPEVPSEFEKALQRRAEEFHRLRRNAMEAALLQRLRADRAVTDEAVTTVLENRFSYERGVSGWGSATAKPEAGKNLFPETKRLIDTLTPLLYGRDALQAELQATKALAFSFERNYAQVAKEAEKAIELLNLVFVDVQRGRLGSILRLADALLPQEKEKALILYFDVEGQCLTWFRYRGQLAGIMRSFFADARKGIIKAYEGDLAALQRFDARRGNVEVEIVPDLAHAIERAGGAKAQQTIAHYLGQEEAMRRFAPQLLNPGTGAETPTEPVPMDWAELPPLGTGPEKKKP